MRYLFAAAGLSLAGCVLANPDASPEERALFAASPALEVPDGSFLCTDAQSAALGCPGGCFVAPTGPITCPSDPRHGGGACTQGLSISVGCPGGCVVTSEGVTVCPQP